MLLSEMETTTWNQALAATGKAQAKVGDTTITVSDGYWGKNPGATIESFITGEVALVIQNPLYYFRETYIKMDERTRDRLASDLLRVLKKEGIESQDVDLDFQPIPNTL
jgi:hypothetical protein